MGYAPVLARISGGLGCESEIAVINEQAGRPRSAGGKDIGQAVSIAVHDRDTASDKMVPPAQIAVLGQTM